VIAAVGDKEIRQKEFVTHKPLEVILFR